MFTPSTTTSRRFYAGNKTIPPYFCVLEVAKQTVLVLLKSNDVRPPVRIMSVAWLCTGSGGPGSYSLCRTEVLSIAFAKLNIRSLATKSVAKKRRSCQAGSGSCNRPLSPIL